MRKLYLLFLCLIIASPLFATNYYVSANTGSDSNDGKSTSTAFATLSKLSYNVNYGPGDTVFVMNGTYTSTAHDVLRISRSGTPDHPIVFKNYPGHTPLISFSTWNAILVVDGASYIVIDGFKIKGANSSINPADALNQPGSCANRTGSPQPLYNGNGISVDGRTNGHCHHVTIRNNEVYECSGGGISAIQSDYITIDNNLVYNNAWYTVYGGSGISVLSSFSIDSNTGFKIYVRNNSVYGNRLFVPWRGTNFSPCAITDGNGIIFDTNNNSGQTFPPYNGQFLVENNISYLNGGRGIHIFKSDNATIRNNTTYQNCQSTELSDGEITIISANNCKVFNNIMYANPKTGGKINSLSGSNNLVSDGNILFNSTTYGFYNNNDKLADPLFVDAPNGNFNLKANSPAINAGTTVAGQYAPTDFAGNTRPLGVKPDIGAYEFTGTPVTYPSFTPGAFVALTLGDGNTPLTANAAPVTLKEYNSAGLPTGVTVPLTNTAPAKITISGAANSFYGQLSLSGDGRYLEAIGLDADPGVSSATLTASTKVITRIDNNGQVNYNTRLAPSSVAVNSVVSDNGGRFWYTGNGGGSATRIANLNATTSSFTLSDQLRSLGVFDGRLYTCGSSAANNNIVYYTGVDPALPTSNNKVNYPFPGFPVTGHSYHSFVLLDQDPAVGYSYTYPTNTAATPTTQTINTRFDVLYCADINLGLVKFYYNGSTWVFAGSYNPPSVSGVSAGLYGLTARVNAAGQVEIFAIKGAVANNDIVLITDGSGRTGNITAAAPVSNNLASAGVNYMFKGVALSPSAAPTIPPVITSISPATGVAGNTVTITGTNLQGVSAVSFGGTPASSFTEVTPSTVTAVVGNGSSGAVALATANGTAVFNGFTYKAPSIISFSPAAAAYGDTVIISGANLDATSQVTFGGVPALSVVNTSSAIVRAIVGTGATGDLMLTTPGGAVTKGGFTFLPSPQLTGVSISNQVVTLRGANFSGVKSITADGSSIAAYTVADSSRIFFTLTSPALSSITVSTTGGSATITTSANARLSSLIADAGNLTPAFQDTILNYTLAPVNHLVSGITITPALADTTARIKINGQAAQNLAAFGPVSLQPGINSIAVEVTAQNGINVSTYHLQVTRKNESVLSFSPIVKTYGDSDFTLQATSTNDQVPLTYSTADSSVIRIDSGRVHVLAAGTATITASQNGNEVYDAAANVSVSLTVNQKQLTVQAQDQTRPFGQPNPDFSISYQGFVNGESEQVLLAKPAASTTAGQYSPAGEYPITITGGQAANYAFNYMSGKLTVTPVTRTLTFSALPTAIYGDFDIDLTAISNTGDAVTFTSSNTAVATINAPRLHIVGAGTAIITATVPPKMYFNDVAPVAQEFVVNKANQSIAFPPLAVMEKKQTVILPITASSGLPISLSSSDTRVAEIVQGTTVDLLKKGTTDITASQPGNQNYNPAAPVTRTLTVVNKNAGIVVNNFVSPNGDGINDVLLIQGIEKCKKNNLVIFNRTGAGVYQHSGYDNSSVVFNGRASNGSLLPPGTYYYQLTYTYEGEEVQELGYLVIKY